MALFLCSLIGHRDGHVARSCCSLFFSPLPLFLLEKPRSSSPLMPASPLPHPPRFFPVFFPQRVSFPCPLTVGGSLPASQPANERGSKLRCPKVTSQPTNRLPFEKFGAHFFRPPSPVAGSVCLTWGWGAPASLLFLLPPILFLYKKGDDPLTPLLLPAEPPGHLNQGDL